ncbi:MAG TPA: cell division protein ZapE [Steroidobacteraceae bacterium]|nr:cell division protein ZapE [Steroidobacteraceae bacterium]
MIAAASFAAQYQRALQAESRAVDPAQAAVAQRLADLADCLADPDPVRRLRMRLRSLLHLWRGVRYEQCCRGVYLWGSVGRGKTWLMDLFQQQVPHSRRLHFQHLMRDVHARLARLQRRTRPLDLVAAQLAAEARVWCVDEFEVQDIGDAMILHGLLVALLGRGVVVVMTSNTPPARLYAGGLQRERFLPAIALLERQLDVVELGAGPDYRLQQLQSAAMYLPSEDAATPARMQQLFERLAGARGMDRAEIMMIEDRPIPARGHAGGLAWFDFAALCEGPRAAADYIAIARQIHTVFLSDVPRFDGRNDDAARRFIALIDELYDRRVRLVISAAAEPTALYSGERLRGAFERTASRLIEMRSAAYLVGTPVPAGNAR